MSEQSSQHLDRTAVHHPQAAGFPAEKTAVEPGPTPDQGTPEQTEFGLPPGDHPDHDLPQDLRPAPRLISPACRAIAIHDNHVSQAGSQPLR
jgi:hypothetical protein